MNKAIHLLFLFAFCFTGVAAEPNPAQPDVAFFTKVRMDYTHRKDFDPAWKIEPEHQQAIAAYHAKDYKKALELAEHWLIKCPVDADMHGIAAGPPPRWVISKAMSSISARFTASCNR